MRDKRNHCTLCYYCANATTSGCSWSEKGTPVEGWKAKPTKIINASRIVNGKYIRKYVDSFDVYRCPEFIEHELCKTEPIWAKELAESLSAKF